MKVGFIQFKVGFGHKTENLEKISAYILKSDADLLVLPELFNSGYLFPSRHTLKMLAEPIPNGRTTQTLIQLARDHQVFLVGGLPEVAGDQFFNSAVLVGPEGYIGHYRKIHLFDTEKKWFTPGDKPFEVYDIGMAKVGLMICFDWFFPEAARSLALKGADIICHPANLVMPYCQQAMLTRSLENRVYTITANRIGSDCVGDAEVEFTGCSQITSVMGEVLDSAARDERMVITDIEPHLARLKKMTAANDVFTDRRPDLYDL